MSHDPAIRPLTLSDAPILQRISTEARERYRSIPKLAYVADTPPVARERFEAGTGWVVEIDGEVLGYALTKPVDDLLFLDNISTQPEANGMGLGSKLLLMVLKGAAARGFETVALTTFRTPPWNGPWFRRYGFLPFPESEVGPELTKIIEMQSRYLDPQQRETLSRRTSPTDE